jgi:hypothetical protein
MGDETDQRELDGRSGGPAKAFEIKVRVTAADVKLVRALARANSSDMSSVIRTAIRAQAAQQLNGGAAKRQ